MRNVISKDGTILAYDKIGTGPAIILVDGAMVYRAYEGHGRLAALLAPHFTVLTYDRRGRGESGNTLPYRVEREIEDLEALIDEAGGSASVYGISSGAALVMMAAIQLGAKIPKIAMYEAPYNSAGSARQAWREYTKELGELLAADRRGDAVGLFMRIVGASPEQVGAVRQTPMWPVFEAIAPTLAYDHIAILGEDAGVPTAQAARLAVPALVMAGSASFPFMDDTARALAEAMPHGHYRALEGQTHEVAAEAIAPVLVEFFAGENGT